jgi:alternate signal-mediated exported protein
MNRTTKGALAAGAAGALLLGGVGTLAFWTDTEVMTGTTIGSGHMQLVSPSCGAGWILDGGATYTTQVLVPGDTLTKVCTYTVEADGAHLTASFDATAPGDVTGAPALVDEISFTDTYKVNTVASGDTDVPIADGDVVEATLVIDWPYGLVDNDSNVLTGLTAALADVTVVATQDHDNTP